MQQTKTSSVITTHSISNVSVLITMEHVSKLKEMTHSQIVVVRISSEKSDYTGLPLLTIICTTSTAALRNYIDDKARNNIPSSFRA